MKYKIGDRVRIKSLDWYNENKNPYGIIMFGNIAFQPFMIEACGQILTIEYVNKDSYLVKENCVLWTDEMIEGLVEEESANYSKVIDNGVSNPIIAKTSSATIDTDKGFYSYSDSDDNLEMEWNLPQGYQFKDENGNVINATKIVLEKKKKEYPKTYEECYKIMGVKLSDCYIQGYKSPLLEDLQELLICRDAYWKIAGEKMGLGKPWAPDWDAKDNHFYTIHTFNGKIECSATAHRNAVLIFPTEEMRDAFKKNFDPDIEICKELL